VSAQCGLQIVYQGANYEAYTYCGGELISNTQTTFIPVRYILEGVITLHEILHELRVKKLPGIILKFEFKRATTK
jgi:hypothetical protein